MTQQMTAAQAAQQDNRTAGGQYTEKQGGEPVVDLPAPPGTVGPAGDYIPCSTCKEAGRRDWAPFEHRDSDDDQGTCPDCAGVDMTEQDRPATWAAFDVHSVLDHVGMRGFTDALALACPNLPKDRLTHWSERFSSASEAVYSDAGDLDEDELGGVWYDEMKSLALDAIDEDDSYRTQKGIQQGLLSMAETRAAGFDLPEGVIVATANPEDAALRAEFDRVSSIIEADAICDRIEKLGGNISHRAASKGRQAKDLFELAHHVQDTIDSGISDYELSQLTGLYGQYGRFARFRTPEQTAAIERLACERYAGVPRWSAPQSEAVDAARKVLGEEIAQQVNYAPDQAAAAQIIHDALTETRDAGWEVNGSPGRYLRQFVGTHRSIEYPL